MARLRSSAPRNCSALSTITSLCCAISPYERSSSSTAESEAVAPSRSNPRETPAGSSRSKMNCWVTKTFVVGPLRTAGAVASVSLVSDDPSVDRASVASGLPTSAVGSVEPSVVPASVAGAGVEEDSSPQADSSASASSAAMIGRGRGRVVDIVQTSIGEKPLSVNPASSPKLAAFTPTARIRLRITEDEFSEMLERRCVPVTSLPPAVPA